MDGTTHLSALPHRRLYRGVCARYMRLALEDRQAFSARAAVQDAVMALKGVAAEYWKGVLSMTFPRESGKIGSAEMLQKLNMPT